MVVIGSIELIVCRLVHDALPAEVLRCLRELHGRGVARFLDLVCVSRDVRGVLHHRPDTVDLGSGLVFTGAVLLQLLEGDHVESSNTGNYGVRSGREVGFDLEAIERLMYRIEPGGAALLALVEPVWVEPLLDAVHAAGGAPLALGFLEPETMLIVGPQLAAATAARAAFKPDT